MFERDYDDLDAFSASIFTVNETLFALQLYDHIPTGDYTLMVMHDSNDDQARLAAFLSMSGIPASAVHWQRPPEAD